jgi:hypothetical protein
MMQSVDKLKGVLHSCEYHLGDFISTGCEYLKDCQLTYNKAEAFANCVHNYLQGKDEEKINFYKILLKG